MLKKDVSRDERWFAMALPGWLDPFGLKVISGVEDCGPLTRPFVVFNGLEVFFKIGLRASRGFGKIFFWGFTGFRRGAMGGEKGLLLGPGTLGGSWGRFAMNGDCFLLGGTCGRPITGWLVIGSGPDPSRGFLGRGFGPIPNGR